jgi:hypothetical protein
MYSMPKYISAFVVANVDELEKVVKEVEVERIICLGLGSLVEGARRISEVQLLLLLEVNKLINVQTEWIVLIQVPILAYDPVFTPLDIEFLESLGITVRVRLMSTVLIRL